MEKLICFSLLCLFVLASPFPRDVEISQSNESVGIRFIGSSTYDGIGYSVSIGGDVDGDGIDDMAIGSPASSFQGIVEGGRVYVIYGKPNLSSTRSEWPTDSNIFTLISTNKQNGRIIEGSFGGQMIGTFVSIVMDLNDDEFDDVVIGAPESDSKKGRVMIVFGMKRDEAITPLRVDDDNSSLINEIIGENSNDRFGNSACGGDFNGDGIGDLMIGALNFSNKINLKGGRVYVLFGKTGGWKRRMNANATEEFVNGEGND